MLFSKDTVLVLLALVGLVACIPFELESRQDDARCSDVLPRKEWRKLTDREKTSYLNAIKCLQQKPSQTKLMGGHIKSRFEDFMALHIILTDEIHGVGEFLPWHRGFLVLYEKALRQECGYTGAQPYWAMDLDVSNWNASPIFNAKFGFGGNGVDVPGSAGPFNNYSIPDFTGGGCLTDGPFAHFNLSIGPGTLATQHCLTRGFNTFVRAFIGPDAVELVYAQPNFEAFRAQLEGAPTTTDFRTLHDSGHAAVGGEMIDRYSSPGDPLFYMHHANLDRHWWTWQQKNLTTRLRDVSGRSLLADASPNVTLAYPLKYTSVGPTVPIEAVMDVRKLCYTYV